MNEAVIEASAEVELVATGIEGMIFGDSPDRTFNMNASTSLATIRRNKRSFEVRLVFNCSSPDNGPKPIAAREAIPVEAAVEEAAGESADVDAAKDGLRDKKFADSLSGVGVVRLVVSECTGIARCRITYPSGYESSSADWFPSTPFSTLTALLPLICISSTPPFPTSITILGAESKLTSDISVKSHAV